MPRDEPAGTVTLTFLAGAATTPRGFQAISSLSAAAIDLRLSFPKAPQVSRYQTSGISSNPPNGWCPTSAGCWMPEPSSPHWRWFFCLYHTKGEQQGGRVLYGNTAPQCLQLCSAPAHLPHISTGLWESRAGAPAGTRHQMTFAGVCTQAITRGGQTKMIRFLWFFTIEPSAFGDWLSNRQNIQFPQLCRLRTLFSRSILQIW